MQQTMFDKREGFTLIEIMVAMTIVAVGITAIVQLFSGSLRLVSSSEGYTKAVVMAQSKIRSVTTDDNLREEEYTENVDSTYMYHVAIQQLDKDRTEPLQFDLYAIKVTVKWKSAANEKSYTLNTLYAKKKDTVTKTS
ncbi:general secretion pathway protein H [Candidatus Magnetobacterium bavaricum]|uniref:General secretion pathway protein H n=1 Tax=Candidatus Magnetobacterium bavaricum TaxID=29290 RepID=A0A0F3GRY3_9BACT|nr:general secretion pathway protein H [Candidatus Magnetobacterium bavaricum]